MVQEMEDWFQLRDGTKLYTKTWQPDSPPNAILVFLHGFSDHINAYYSLFPTLASPPYSLLIQGFDQRGWGRTVTTRSTRGLTGPTNTVLNDVHAFLTSVASTHPNLPLFLMGHSMGGATALHYLLTTLRSVPITSRPKIAGLLLDAPYIALDPDSRPHALTVAAGKVAAKLVPNRQLVQKLDSTYMSRDPQVRQDWEADPLCHDTGTLAGLAGMLQRSADLVALGEGAYVRNLTNELPCPLWVGHGDADRVTSCKATQKLFGVLEVVGADRTFKVYEGGYHKLHAEPGAMKDEFARDVGDWILTRMAGPVRRETSGGSQPKL